MISDDNKQENVKTQFQIFMEIVNDLVVIIDQNEDFSIELINKCPLLEKLGYSDSELTGKPFSQIVSSEDSKKVTKFLKKGVETFESFQEIKLSSVKKEIIWAEIKAKKFTDENNKQKILLILKDITKQKKIEVNLKDTENRFKKITETIPEIRFWKLFNPKKYEEALQSSYEMLQMVMENIPQYIIWKDLNLSYLGCNDNYATLIGIEHPENIIDKKDEELLWDEKQIDYNRKQEIRVIESNEAAFHNVETWALKNGEIIWIDVNRIPLLNSDGKVAGLLITFEDITERKNSEENLRMQHERLERIMETNPAGILSIDTNGQIIMVNSQAEKVLHYPKEELLKKSFIESKFKLIDSEGNPIPKDELPFQIIMQTRKPLFDYHATFKLAEDENILLSINGTPLIGSNGNIENIIFTVEDITEKVLTEQKIKDSEEKLRDLLETSTIGVLEIELEQNSISYLNPRLLEFIGYQDISVVNEKLLNEIIHPDDLLKLLNSEDGKEIEFRIVTKLGKIKWLQGKRLNQHDDKGKLISFRLWLEDVTEKKIYEELIYELNINFLNYTTDTQQNIELLLKTCLKLLSGAVVLYINKSIIDEEEQYRVMSNKGDVRIYGSEEFNRDLFVSQVFHENHDFTQEFYDIDKSEYVKTDRFIMEQNIKACYGKLILSGNDLNDMLCVLFTENPTISNQNKLVLFLICDALEIEQRRWKTQQHLEEQNRMLSEINKLKSDLFSRTSHELNTPLISIKGFTDLLLELHSEKLDADVIEILGEIQNGSKRLGDYINSLVESSQLEQGRLKLRKEKEDLTFLINDCVKQLQGFANLREQKIKVNIKNKIFTVFDKEKIYKVITNLLINAIKYTPVGGHITIDSKQKDGHYIVSIKDTGIGLTQKEIEQLFTQFGKIERYGQGWDVGIGGTGLGLYISKELITLHEGKIWVESEGRDKGSTFFFSLPIIKN
ncbi:MAG: PAS domain S-box protein [Candidatus Lokiarchaeota archaeon]|nr:PAS domain S-box protein [Candidatus Lokiarchaeota archaeon]